MRSSARTAPGRPGTITGSAGATPSTISSALPAARSRSGSSPNSGSRQELPPPPLAGEGISTPSLRLRGEGRGEGPPLAEKIAQCRGEVLRVVALHGVAGFGDRDPATIGEPRSQPLGILVVEHVALAAAHDEGRAGDPSEPVGKPAPLG